MQGTSWLGIGDALDAHGDFGKLRDMYDKWPWFKTNIDLIETLLAKTEPSIAKHYEDVLLKDAPQDLLALGAALRDKLDKTSKAVLRVSGRDAPAGDNHLLQRALRLRNPYVDVLNVLQVEVLRRQRAAALSTSESTDGDQKRGDDAASQALDDALLVTINGIAAGMQKSG